MPTARSTAALALAAALLAPAAARADTDRERRLGDALSIAIPVATLGTEWWRGDREGATQFALTFAVTTATTEVLKRTTGVERPDGSNDLSFPSGHAARAFSAAAYVRARHGLQTAAPLYAAALYVGHTRVQAQRHRWGDVLGAALVAEAAAAWWVTRAPSSPVVVVPMLGPDGVGVQLAARW